MRFDLYFEGILNRKLPLSYRNNYISYRDTWGFGGHARGENFEMIDAIWCVLMYYFDQIKSQKVSLFIIKNIDYSYTLAGYTLAMRDAP